jgi:RNA polymerase sigma-70 factor (ECF subfamily)
MVAVPESHDTEARAAERALIQRAQAGDAEAVAQLYQAHAPAIYRYFMLRVQEPAAAEDLTGEVFLKVVEALPRYVDRGVPFAGWLFRIAHDRAVDYRRRSAVRQVADLPDAAPDGAADTEAQALGRVERQHLATLVAELTEDQQFVIQLRFVEGLSLEETATLLGKTAGAIKALQHRALQRLGRRLTELQG